MDKKKRTALTAGIAAFVLAVSPAALAQGNGKGSGGGKGDAKAAQSKGNSAPAKRGNGGNKGAKSSPKQVSDGNSNGNAGRGSGNDRPAAKSAASGNGAAKRANANAGNSARALDKRNNGNSAKANRANVNNVNANRGNRDQRVRVRSRDGTDIDVGFALPQLRQTLARDTRVINGCPPGLAKKSNGCLPPGQAKKAYRNLSPGFFGLSGIGAGQYFYDDGYLLSYNGDGLAGYLPLLGGALGIGNVWPANYAAAPLPNYYGSYYGLDNPRGYRFADNVIYRVDPETAAIASVAALLTGDDITIGRPMPAGYDVYNVPYSYRDRYADSPRANYRYADGYIYEVDPETALVVSAIDLVT